MLSDLQCLNGRCSKPPPVANCDPRSSKCPYPEQYCACDSMLGACTCTTSKYPAVFHSALEWYALCEYKRHSWECHNHPFNAKASAAFRTYNICRSIALTENDIPWDFVSF